MNHINWNERNLIVHNGKGRVDRVVYFSQDAETVLENRLKERQGVSPFCFTRTAKPYHPILSRKSISGRMQILLEKCDLEGKGYTPHSLRHTYDTLLLNANVPLETLRELMGHKRLDETLRYAQLSNRKIRDSYEQAIESIERDNILLEEMSHALHQRI